MHHKTTEKACNYKENPVTTRVTGLVTREGLELYKNLTKSTII